MTKKRAICQRSYAAVFRRDDELGDLSSVDTENVLHLSGENVPDDDGEVHSPGHQRALVVAGGDLVRIQDARHLVPVTSQGAMGRPACGTDGRTQNGQRHKTLRMDDGTNTPGVSGRVTPDRRSALSLTNVNRSDAVTI